MNTGGQKVLLYLAAAIAGGVAAYLITEVVIDRLTYGSPDGEEDNAIVVLEEKKETKKIGESKPALADLIREYTPNPKEDGVAPVRIVSEEEAYKLMSKHNNAVQLITYYQGDGVFVGEDMDGLAGEEGSKNGVILENPEEILAPNIHLMFDMEESDTIYSWNEPLSTMFIVTKVDGSFNKKADGQPKTPKIRRRRTTGKKPGIPADEVAEDDGKKSSKPRRV